MSRQIIMLDFLEHHGKLEQEKPRKSVERNNTQKLSSIEKQTDVLNEGRTLDFVCSRQQLPEQRSLRGCGGHVSFSSMVTLVTSLCLRLLYGSSYVMLRFLRGKAEGKRLYAIETKNTVDSSKSSSRTWLLESG